MCLSTVVEVKNIKEDAQWSQYLWHCLRNCPCCQLSVYRKVTLPSFPEKAEHCSGQCKLGERTPWCGFVSVLSSTITVRSQLADGGGEHLSDMQALHTLTRETLHPEFSQRKMFQAGRDACISGNPSHLSRTSMLVQLCDEFAIIRVNRKDSRAPHSISISTFAICAGTILSPRPRRTKRNLVCKPVSSKETVLL